MSDGELSAEGLGARIEEAQQRLRDAAESAEAAEKRATAEIRALEADLEKERLRGTEALEQVREGQEADLRQEREAKERAIAAAEERLTEIEGHAEEAEKRVEAAERRAASSVRCAVLSDTRGVGHPEQALSDVRRAEARSAQIGGPDGISQCFQVSAYSGEPFTSKR